MSTHDHTQDHIKRNYNIVWKLCCHKLQCRRQYPVCCPLQWRHNEHDGVSNHRRRDCLLNCLFRRRSKKRPKLHVTGLCEGNSPVTGEFPTQRANNAEDVSIWWRHHAKDGRAYQRTVSWRGVAQVGARTTVVIDSSIGRASSLRQDQCLSTTSGGTNRLSSGDRSENKIKE